mmetsp:Transcript_10340/g.1632  ORF Transcript_10340/g.1632 Transcript_10340/m.1632 type:complete len:113 (-) Transcript_10340:533-871(-)
MLLLSDLYYNILTPALLTVWPLKKAVPLIHTKIITLTIVVIIIIYKTWNYQKYLRIIASAWTMNLTNTSLMSTTMLLGYMPLIMTVYWTLDTLSKMNPLIGIMDYPLLPPKN